MARIDELLRELCPDGVEYKALGEVAKYAKSRIDSGDIAPGSYVGVNELKQDYLGRTNDVHIPAEDRCIEFLPGDVLLGNIRPYLKKAWLANCRGGTNGDVLVIRPNDDSEIVAGYLFKIITGSTFTNFNIAHSKGSKMPRGDKKEIMQFCIPVPPMEVQEEVVRILDSMAALEANLRRELDARRTQYACYRDCLLDFGDDVPRVRLGELMRIERGASPRPIKKFVTEDSEGVPWIKIGDVDPAGKYITSTKERITEAGKAKSRYLEAGSFILSNSMSFGRPYILKLNGCIHDGWLSLREFEDSYQPDFLYQLLRSESIQSYWAQKANSGSVSNLNADIVKDTVVPVPTFEQQEQAIELLDKFDMLCNNEAHGLMAEISARHRQYEHYRDRLLAFPEKEA